jgi:adenylate cyclase
MRAKGKTLQILTIVAAALLAGEGQFWFPVAKLQWAADDWLEVTGRKAVARPELVFLAVDDASVRLEPEVDLADFLDNENPQPEERRALELMAGRSWPWSREVWALVIERLAAAGARAVVLDFTFPKPGNGDDALRSAIERHAGRVVVAGNLVQAFGDRLGSTDDHAVVFSVPAGTVVPEELRDQQVVGYDNFWPHPDGRVRSAVYSATLENLPDDAPAEEQTFMRSLAALGAQKAGFAAPPAEDRRPRHMRFAGPARTFQPLSVFEIFVPRYWRANYGSGTFFEGKIVVVGAYGNWQQDEHATPFGMMPGPEIHLNAINNLLNRERVSDLPAWPRRSVVYAAASLALLLSTWISRPFLRLAGCAGLAGCWAMLALWLYNEGGLLAPTLVPGGMLLFGGFTCVVGDFVAERKDKARVRRTLERYVSRNVVGELLDHPEAFHAALGGVDRKVTILFTDIRNFTRFSARTSSQQLVAQLNEYFTAMVECVFEHGGTLDKFIGDALMAVWGNATSKGAAADGCAAVRCALAMRAALARLNNQWAAAGRPTLDVGMALQTGDVVVGNIGSPNKMEFTVIGDAVNATWRLQERTKEYPGEILLGDALARLVESEFETEELGSLTVGGCLEVGFSRLAVGSCVPEAGDSGALVAAGCEV